MTPNGGWWYYLSMATHTSQTSIDKTEPRMCLCGRQATQLHCAWCGWADVRALTSKSHYEVMPDGTERVIMTYRCRKCGQYSTDKDRELHCQAPPPKRGRVPEELRPKAVAEVLPEERINELDERTARLLAKFGKPFEELSPKERLEYMRELSKVDQ